APQRCFHTPLPGGLRAATSASASAVESACLHVASGWTCQAVPARFLQLPRMVPECGRSAAFAYTLRAWPFVHSTLGTSSENATARFFKVHATRISETDEKRKLPCWKLSIFLCRREGFPSRPAFCLAFGCSPISNCSIRASSS